MGQYHILVNLDMQEKVHPYGLGLGMKQWEHLGDFNGTLSDAMYLLCMSSPASGGGDLPKTVVSGRWCGSRVIILGDYTTLGGIRGFSKIKSESLWKDVSSNYMDISQYVAEAFKQAFQVEVDGKNHWKTVFSDSNIEGVINESD